MMTADPKALLFIIHKAGRGWYRDNAQGYTTHIVEAGRYTQDEAEAHAFPNGRNGPRDGLTFEMAPESLLTTPTDADLITRQQAEIEGHVTRKFTDAEKAAVLEAFVTSTSGGGRYFLTMGVPNLDTLHALHDAILKARAICAGQ